MSAEPIGEVHALPHWQCVDFISDLHLSSATPRTLQVWRRYLQDTCAQAVFILGDLFEVWVGDDSAQQPFEAHCVTALQAASSRLALYFMPGNRDFLVGAQMHQACGWHALNDPALLHAFGRRTVLTHGDAWCLDDHEYQQFRQLVRSDTWQREFLSQPLAQRQASALRMRQASQARKAGQPDPELWADVDLQVAQAYLQEAQAHDIVHGHTHRPGSQNWAPGYWRHVLSDWDYDQSPHRAQVLRLDAQGFRRLAPEQAAHRLA